MTHKSTFKLIIATSSGFSNYDLLEKKCDAVLAAKINDPSVDVQIVCGSAGGCAELGIQYAVNRGLALKVFKGDISKANVLVYLRNVAMADYADALIAFDAGTVDIAHIIKVSETRKRLVRVVKASTKN